MNLFCVVYAKHNSVEKYRNFYMANKAALCPFGHIPDHTERIHTTQRIFSVSMSLHAEQISIGSYTHEESDRFIMFNGVPVLGDHALKGQSWAQALLPMLDRGNLHQTLGGYYSIALVQPERITAYVSQSPAEPLYVYENSDCIAIGNKAALVWALANVSLNYAYNHQALISLCTIGWAVHFDTAFQGVRLVPPGSVATIEHGTYQSRIVHPYDCADLDQDDPNFSRELDHAFDDVCDRLLAHIRTVSKLTEKSFVIPVTGGKDSRILAAMCKHAGLRFSTYTSGGEGDRDVVVGRQVAELLGVDHRISEIKGGTEIPEIDMMHYLHRQVLQGDGLTNFYDPCYDIRSKPTFQFFGHAGECFRGGYDMVRMGSRPPIEGPKDIRKFLSNLLMHNVALLLNDHGASTQKGILDKEVERFIQSDWPNSHFYDYMLYVYREGRAVALNRQAASYGSFQFSPYLDALALSASRRIPFAMRKQDYIFYQILKRTVPSLTKLRFADSRWKFEEFEPLPGESHAEWKEREPLPPSSRRIQMKNWRYGYDTYMRKLVQQYILDNKQSSIFQYVDYKKVEHLLAQPGPTGNNVIRSVYGLLGCISLLNDEWFPHTPANEKPILVPPPSNESVLDFGSTYPKADSLWRLSKHDSVDFDAISGTLHIQSNLDINEPCYLITDSWGMDKAPKNPFFAIEPDQRYRIAVDCLLHDNLNIVLYFLIFDRVGALEEKKAITLNTTTELDVVTSENSATYKVALRVSNAGFGQVRKVTVGKRPLSVNAHTGSAMERVLR